ncbi:iron-sulfur protein [Kitasatospora sp. NPDC006697]|uniref:iron-sulfur protein n=1 Tax=Kitasatospora sp. NPDC006697 TaxID=3364020 RepID=UPI0036B7B65B
MSTRTAAATVTAAPHPCATAHAAFTRVFPDLRIRLTAPPRPAPGWTATGDLLASAALRARLVAAETRRTELRHGAAPRPDVAAGFWLHRLVWPLGLLLSLPWLLDARVPLLPADRLAHRHPARGGPAELAVLPGAPVRFACLPDDPRAGHPAAVPVPDRAALDRELRTAFAAQLDPLFTALAPQLRRGPRTLWGLATDELTEGLWFAAGLLGRERQAVEALSALLPGTGTTAPYTGGAAFRRTPAGPCRTRVSCCLFYTVRPTDPCTGCPREQRPAR